MKVNKKFDMIREIAYDRKNQFSKLAKYVVERDVNPINGEQFTKESLDVITECLSADMSMGALLVRRKYIAIGLIIGVTITGITLTLTD